MSRFLKQVLYLFLEKTPKDVDIEHLKEHLLEIKDVEDIHHIHVWSIDGFNNYATMHIVTKSDDVKALKKAIREPQSITSTSTTTKEAPMASTSTSP